MWTKKRGWGLERLGAVGGSWWGAAVRGAGVRGAGCGSEGGACPPRPNDEQYGTPPHDEQYGTCASEFRFNKKIRQSFFFGGVYIVNHKMRFWLKMETPPKRKIQHVHVCRMCSVRVPRRLVNAHKASFHHINNLGRRLMFLFHSRLSWEPTQIELKPNFVSGKYSNAYKTISTPRKPTHLSKP